MEKDISVSQPEWARGEQGLGIREDLQTRSIEYLIREGFKLIKLSEDCNINLKFINEELEKRKSKIPAKAAENHSVSTQDVKLNGGFEIVCDETNNTKEDQEQRRINVDMVFISNGEELESKMDEYPSIKKDTCESCGCPWYFSKQDVWECTMCGTEVPKPWPIDRSGCVNDEIS